MDEDCQRSVRQEPTIGRLFNDVKVFCWVATYPLSHKTKAHAISVTWGKQCNRIIFVSNGTDDELPIIVVKLNESRSELWSKTRAAFTWIYDNVLDDYEWFLKADDDTYMHMDNLRALLSNYSSSDALAIGHQFKSQDGHPTYHSGGAGYVLSREAVRRLVSEGFTNVSECNKQNHHEDVFIGICLNELNVTVVDGADENGTYRFHVIALYDFLLNRVPDWMKIKSRTEVKKSFACCSPHFISMHYTTADQQYMIDYLTHHLKPYGVQH
ncbi:N-acetyllactosaminide 3-alpha-galactosyltransferase [Ancylostoma ceylanicum]|uniref:N-acetylgalactosaminide beta-1,3-galactosyltransferase n=1 Tax=Ancylostoma ceylanicum TaxID=53326 RepID=A0A0D6MBR9_9BILA|nr:N-acetyllactosaminide 3-alpha-galactosyltransferase [Ancylostoma ceylanicum]